MTDREVIAGVLGIVIGLASSLIGVVLQHVLSLRADKIRRERDREDEESREMLRIAREKEPQALKVARHTEWLRKRGKKK
jgi:hypothetical protein